MRTPAVLTASEIEIMRLAQDDPSIFTEYFFKPKTGKGNGWRFDDNFVTEGAWQRTVHEARQTDILVIGGFGTGKTSGIGMSAITWASLTADFKFLNAAPRGWQSKLMYDGILTTARNTRFEDLIWESPRRPYPKIIIRYMIGEIVYESTLEFMSADKNAEGILSWEGDWLNLDEAGLLDNLEEVIISLGSRLRGSVRGRERLGRFSMTSNSWDNFTLWYTFDLAKSQPEDYLSLQVSSRHNKNVTDRQLRKMVARIPKDERERFIEGTRPEGRGKFFDKESVYACEEVTTGSFVQEKYEAGQPGYIYEKGHGIGVVDFALPPVPGNLYMFFGDPGVGAAPQRNAPVWIGWDVTNFPTLPARMIYFWWGNGGGRIGPFVDRMLESMEIYKPIITGIDSTGPQRNMAYLINEYLFREKFATEDSLEPGFEAPLGHVKGVVGLDFSSGKKPTYLQAARLLLEQQMFSWPKDIVGMRSQLTNYDPEKDRGLSGKLAQDIVSTFSMSAHSIRIWFHVDPQELLSKRGDLASVTTPTNRQKVSTHRNKRSARARPSLH